MTDEIRELFAMLEAWWNSQCPLSLAECADCRESLSDCRCKAGEA